MHSCMHFLPDLRPAAVADYGRGLVVCTDRWFSSLMNTSL